MSQTLSLFHIVFSTFRREPTIAAQYERELYRLLHEMIVGEKCSTLRINGTANHVHIFLNLHPTVSLASLVAKLKRVSSSWMRTCGKFPDFKGWGKEYFAASKSIDDKEVVINYIKNQKEHHKIATFDDELKSLAAREGMEWSDYYLG